MTRRNIGAFTDAGADYPAFISVNVDDNNMIEITIRSPHNPNTVGSGTTSTIVIDRATWANLLNQSIGALNE